jgi:Fe-S-cluster containining protein
MLKLLPLPDQLEIDKFISEGNDCINIHFPSASFQEVATFKQMLQSIHKCHKCGNCCYSDPIRLYIEDIRKLSKHFNISQKQVIKQYTRREYDNTFSIKTTCPCMFYDKGCKIYDSRPLVCRSYPFLSSNKEDVDKNIISIELKCKGQVDAYNTAIAQSKSFESDENAMKIRDTLLNNSDLQDAFRFIAYVTSLMNRKEISIDKAYDMMMNYKNRPMLDEAIKIIERIKL